MTYNVIKGALFMLKGILQTDKRLLKVIQKYGCLFLCFAHASPIVFEGAEGIRTLNIIWQKAEFEGIISGDLNKDGDYDDAGEAEVQTHDKLAQLFDLPVRYDGKHHSPTEKIPDNVKIIFGCFFLKGTHFVILDRNLEVTFDSYGKSNTVRNGWLKNVRWYYED